MLKNILKIAAITRRGALLLAAVFAVSASPARLAWAEEGEIKIGFVVFLSGAAAGPFGIPSRNAAEVLVEGINAGALPPPYDSPGIGGRKIVPIYVDENSKQKVPDFQKLARKDRVEAVIGYTSSGSCKAVAPVAEELKVFTILFDCGTPQIFEDIVVSPKWLFRTTAHSAADSVGAARYLTDVKKQVSSVAGINQNYAWGQDSWREFSTALKVLHPDVEIKAEQFPKIFAGEYGAEISALLAARPQVIHSSFWGSDMEALVLQGAARGLFQRSDIVLTTGETAMYRLAAQIPDGVIIGARGPNGVLAPDNALNRWFRKAYFDRYGAWPIFGSYDMAQAVLGLKHAFDKAGKNSSAEQAAMALKLAEFETPGGLVRMRLGKGHQAVQDTAYGVYRYDRASGQPTLENIRRYKAECVMPPEGVKTLDWIKSGMSC